MRIAYKLIRLHIEVQCIILRNSLNRVPRSLFALDGDGFRPCGRDAWSFEAERGDELEGLPGFDRRVNSERIVFRYTYLRMS